MRLKIKLSLFICLGMLVSTFSHYSLGQKFSVNKNKVAYFGLTGGFNFTSPKVTDHYSVLNSIGSSDDESLQKKYDKMGKNKGAQFGVVYSYNFTNSIGLVTGFGYQSYGFKYFTNYSWSDSLANQNFSREMHHLQKVSYFTWPIMVRYELGKAQFMPYAQGGIFMDFRHQAKKIINYDNTIDEEETESELSSSSLVSITDNFMKFNMGIMAGIGINYHTKFITFGVETNFRYGFRKIGNDQSRYSDINGFALQYLDVLDQMRLRNLNVQFSATIPINHSVTTNILRRRRY